MRDRPPVTDVEKAFEYDRAIRLLERLSLDSGLVRSIQMLHRAAERESESNGA